MTHKITTAAPRTRRIALAALVAALVASALFMTISDATASLGRESANSSGVIQNSDSPSTIPTRGGCGQTFNPDIRGRAEAHWTLSCSGGKITMTGWVKDTKSDGKCAYVKAVFSDGSSPTPAKACPSGDKTSFSWSGPGSLADGYLYLG